MTIFNSSIKKIFDASLETKQKLVSDEPLLALISLAAEACVVAINRGGKVIFCGNGGSFADAQHLSAEFTSRFMFDRPAAPSLALGTNSSSMSAIGNDYGYDQVFARELSAIGSSLDVFIPITTSGNSPNIIAACEVALNKKIKTFALMGLNEGKLPDSVEMLRMPSADTARIQECHILVGHALCEIVEQELFGDASKN